MSALTQQQIDSIYRNPLRLVTDGHMKVISKFIVAENGTISELVAPQRVAFRPNFKQRCMLYVVNECRRRGKPCKIVLIKCRRDGASEVGTKVIAALAAVRDTVMVSAVAPNDNVINNVSLPMLKRAFQSLPIEFRPDFSREFTNPLHFSRKGNPALGIASQDDCEINLISAQVGSSAGIGTACTYAWLTETSYLKKDDAAMEGFTPTILESPETFVLQESVAQGPINYHARAFKLSWEMQGRVNPSKYEDGYSWDTGAPEIAMFFPWFWTEDRILPLVQGVTAADFMADLDEYEQQIVNMPNGLMDFARKNRDRVYLMTPKGPSVGLPSEADLIEYVVQQLHWRRAYSVKVPEYGYGSRKIRLASTKTGPSNIISLNRTIPSTVDEALTGDEVMAFPDTIIQQHHAHLREPLIGRLQEDGSFEEDKNGWLKLWFAPDSFKGGEEVHETRRLIKQNNGFAPRKLYVTAEDFAYGDFTGDEKLDKSAVVVLTWGGGAVTQVAEVDIREPLPAFEAKCHRLRRFLSGNQPYRTPFEIPECSGPGRHYAQSIANPSDPQYADYYGRLFYSRRVGNTSNPEFVDKPGFEASIHKMQQLAWTHFFDVIVGVRCRIRSRALLSQVASLARKGDSMEARNKGAAGEGSKDDIADALKMGLYFVSELEKEYGAPSSAFSGFCDDDGDIHYRAPDEYDRDSPEFRAIKEVEEKNRRLLWWQPARSWVDALKQARK